MKNYAKTSGIVIANGYKGGKKINYSFDNAIKGLGVVTKWDTELAVKK